MPTPARTVFPAHLVSWIASLLSAVMLMAHGVLVALSVPDPPRGATPVATGCEGARSNIEEILGLLGEQATTDAFPGKPILDSLPPGAAPDATTAAEIERVYRHVEACANSGNPTIGILGYFSDDGLVREFGGMSPESVAELRDLATMPATPVPAGSRFVFTGPWHVQALDDGRILAAVVWFGNEADICLDPLRIDVLVFVQQDGQWLIDEWIERIGMLDPVDVVGLPPDSAMKSPLARCADAPPPVRGPNN